MKSMKHEPNSKLSVAYLGIAVASFALVTQAQESEQRSHAMEELIIVDASNQERIVLKVNSENAASIQLLDADGNPAISLFSGPSGAAKAIFGSRDYKSFLEVTIEQDAALLRMINRGPEGRTRSFTASLGQDTSLGRASLLGVFEGEIQGDVDLQEALGSTGFAAMILPEGSVTFHRAGGDVITSAVGAELNRKLGINSACSANLQTDGSATLLTDSGVQTEKLIIGETDEAHIVAEQEGESVLIGIQDPDIEAGLPPFVAKYYEKTMGLTLTRGANMASLLVKDSGPLFTLLGDGGAFTASVVGPLPLISLTQVTDGRIERTTVVNAEMLSKLEPEDH